MKKNYIWQNTDLNVDDWRDAYNESCEINGIEPGDDYDIMNFMYATNNEYWFDERMNLDKYIDTEILVIADLGLWNGRTQGYRIIESGNLKEILSYNGNDCFEIYGDGENIRAVGNHHDGVNYYLYRAVRPGKDIDPLLTAILRGDHITRQKLNHYTRSIYKDVAKIYGWED